MIETNWGGTIVEAWSTPEGLNSCDIAPNDDNPPNANSYLFNAMINPLLKNTIYGALWYQGKLVDTCFSVGSTNYPLQEKPMLDGIETSMDAPLQQ